MDRACCFCGTTKDIRPYGPGGKDMCFKCMKDPAHPEREREAKQRFLGQLSMSGDVAVLDDANQVGPRPATSQERELLGKKP